MIQNHIDNDDDIIMSEHQVERKERNSDAGLWHYIKVFCCFFPLITTIGCILLATESLMGVEELGLILMGVGILSALIAAPGKYFKFGFLIISSCAVWGFCIFIFPFNLATALCGILVGVMGTIVSLVFVPAIFSIYTYITDIRYDGDNTKKELIVIASAIIAAVVLSAATWGVSGIAAAANAGELDEKFQVVSIYQNYIGDYELAEDYPAEILEAPISSEKTKNGYFRTNTYDFTRTVNNVLYHYNLNIDFKYIKSGDVSEWVVMDVSGSKYAIGHETITGTYTGEGEYPGNPLSSKNPYSCSITLPNDGNGYGTLDVAEQHLEFTIEEGDFVNSKNGNSVKLIFKFKKPLVVAGFFSDDKTYEELNCVYNFDKNTLIISDLNKDLELTIQD